MNNFNEFKNLSLSKSEMAKISGGQRDRYRCECTGNDPSTGNPSVGVWHGNYSSQSSAESESTTWCSSGTAECAVSGPATVE